MTYTQTVKIANFIRNSPALSAIFKPLARVYVRLSGYRNMGLRFHDIIIEETPEMQRAIHRLPSDEAYKRQFRQIRAHQCGITQHILPPNERITDATDIPYLKKNILQTEKEAAERLELDNIFVKR
ncbi:hypothetical protein CANCADRAFT_743 [Tortispora caseinolytica NRRL Y-17796]|uniref:Cytochrome b-c1 complex subunit 7 n=1 Tax=Tortispora caseinolytica NRRL Y-17796 TaxID=767744 RepID=A0A1E4TK66_9ASCO|nr:hypothetical protein CANCADRAFT_743 [Tortispora caseinolytica NRRL Y-17796]